MQNAIRAEIKRLCKRAFERAERWSRPVRQPGGLAKVDRDCFYAASCSVISAVA